MRSAPLVDELYRLAETARLTPAHRRVLAYLADHSDDALFLSTGELARAAGVSQPTVTRLAAALGFDGYTGLREQLQSRSRVDGGAGERGGKFDRIVEGETEKVAAVLEGIGDAELEELGASLMRSPHLVVAAWRASGYLRDYFAYLARKIHPHVVVVGGSDVEALASSRRQGATVAVFLIVPRYPRIAVESLIVAHRLGYRCVVITDTRFAPPVALGDDSTIIRLPMGSGAVFDAHPAPLVMLGLLLEAMADSDVAGIDATLEALEDDAMQLGTYW